MMYNNRIRRKFFTHILLLFINYFLIIIYYYSFTVLSVYFPRRRTPAKDQKYLYKRLRAFSSDRPNYLILTILNYNISLPLIFIIWVFLIIYCYALN